MATADLDDALVTVAGAPTRRRHLNSQPVRVVEEVQSMHKRLCLTAARYFSHKVYLPFLPTAEKSKSFGMGLN